MLTASNQDRDIATSKRLGAEDYIVKPVDFQNLSEVTPKLSFVGVVKAFIRTWVRGGVKLPNKTALSVCVLKNH